MPTQRRKTSDSDLPWKTVC
jgi:serine/threonine protein phosphatase PrpC